MQLSGPFGLNHSDDYALWRDEKLSACPPGDFGERVEIVNPYALTSAELGQLKATIRRLNFALFAFKPVKEPQKAITALGKQLGLNHLDQNLCANDQGITPLTVRETHTDKPYIPYTNRPLSWHTDGYYNLPDKRIRAWVLYCEQDAATGGENEILDHEMAYLALREKNPELIQALSQNDCFTIPANEEGGEQIRANSVGPVFWTDENASLYMRYSARKRNVIWKDDEITQLAAQAILDLFNAQNGHILRYRLSPGEGLVSNNVLHRREGFTDAAETGKKRVLYRARYFDRINTG